MKVLYILPSYSIYSGDNLSILNLLIGLSQFNVEPLVVVSKKATFFSELEKFNIPYKVVLNDPTAYSPPCNNLKDSILFLWRLVKYSHRFRNSIKEISSIVKEFKPQIIHSNTGPTMSGYKISRKYKIHHVWHIREYLDLDFQSRLLFSSKEHRRRLSERNNYAIAITKDLFHYYNLSAKDRVIYNGILKAGFARLTLNKKKYFLFVGRLTEKKGAGQLIKAFIKFTENDSDFQLLLAGGSVDQGYLDLLKEDVKQNKLENRVFFLGERNDVHDLMLFATALIVPSAFEGFGRITAEAMFNGCLVIGNNSGGTKEILKENNAGVLYSSQEELTSAMHAVIKNGIDYYYPIIKKAQEQAVSLYSQERNASEVYKYYTEILRNN
jgi:glycosyltransferase involved in cell wall biosynthesis